MTDQERDQAQQAGEGEAPAYEPPAVVQSLPFENIVLADPFECGEGCTTDFVTGDPC
jgi:hypothetical protein